MERAAKWARRNPVVSVLGASVAALLILGTLIS
jgi:hypothetical protein